MKTLLKIEFRATWAMLIYFITTIIFIFTTVITTIQDYVIESLQNGISTVMYKGLFTMPLMLFNENISTVTHFMCVGIIALVYLSFKNDSNHETGRFLKTLPFTIEQRYFTKIGVGLSIITISYVIYATLILYARQYLLSEWRPLYEVTLLNNDYTKLLPFGALLQYLIVAYLFMIVFYLFLVMFEYLISDNVPSLVIGILVGLSPIFIAGSMASIFRNNIIYRFMKFINNYYASLFPSRALTIEHTTFYVENSNEFYGFGQVEILKSFGMKCILYLVIIAIIMFYSWWLCKKQTLENDDILMPMAWTRWIFIVGVTVCSALIFADIYLLFYQRHTLEIMWLIIGGIVGFIIAWFIAHKGLKTLRGIRK